MQEGLYESVWTTRLVRELATEAGIEPEIGVVDDIDQPHVLSQHLLPIIERALERARGTSERTDIVRRVLLALSDATVELEEPARDSVSPPVRQLLSATRPPADQLRVLAPPSRPATPLAQAALLTNTRGEPNLAAELRAEFASADGVDLLCAFIKWQGVRLLGEQLRALRHRGIRFRVITTTYLGATDARALDALVDEFGAEVRINYETDRTRLHAKAWLLRRNTGFSTAYVGSSNLSHAALVDGLEWNVRLSEKATPALLDKFHITFDSYWQNPDFQPYSPREDGDRLRSALDVASGRYDRDRLTVTLSGLEVRPRPFQAEMLEEIEAERVLHDRHRNLVVAATGTGKTVIAALDYRRLVQSTHGQDLTLLFVAHRVEILRQAQRIYREVLSDPGFGELLSSGQKPRHWRHVFASIQSLTAEQLQRVEPERFDVVVVDEFHHAEAASYRRLLRHVRPRELLGLTATPERGDGVDVRAYFEGRVAAELRLWDALDQNLLCPFHYFGVYDGTNLAGLSWSRGSYNVAALSDLFTGDDARTRIVLAQLRDKVSDIGLMRALGFCVSIAHAHYMTQRFVAAGIPARAVSAETPATEREEALRALKHREINVLFAVDLFNEGLDIPEIDTVLFLRPTESATVFLQQLGRGLRTTQDKTVLTALDFVGHQRREFRFDLRFRALTGLPARELERQICDGFPFLPSGSQIVLDEIARETVLANIRQQISPRWAALIADARAHEGADLASFLALSGRSLGDVLRRDGRSWTTLCREAGKALPEPGPWEERLRRRVRALAHVDDPLRATGYAKLLSGETDLSSVFERRLAKMLFFSLFPDGGDVGSMEAGLGTLTSEPAVSAEMAQVVAHGFDIARRVTHPLDDASPGLVDVPLAVHASYSREEILSALGHASMRRRPNSMREGVAWCDESNSDAFLVTIRKSAARFSPTTMYRDYALSPDLFHWESQSTTSADSPTGQRYIHHRQGGTHVLLFVRSTQEAELGTSPYIFLGPADYVSHTGSRPMAITWRLHRTMPTEVYLAARAAAA